MSDFKHKLAAPYRADCQSLEEQARFAQQLPRQITPSLRQMPALIEKVEHRTKPYWEGRIKAVEQRLIPLDVKALHAEMTKLRQASKLSWRTPMALRIRSQNLFFRIAILAVHLAKLGIVLYLISWFIRLIWYLA